MIARGYCTESNVQFGRTLLYCANDLLFIKTCKSRLSFCTWKYHNLRKKVICTLDTLCVGWSRIDEMDLTFTEFVQNISGYEGDL